MNSRRAAYREVVSPQSLATGERQAAESCAPFPAWWRHRAARWLVHRGLRFLLSLYAGLMRAAKLVGPQKRPVGGEGYDILLTGTFHSDNWITSHVLPLAKAKHCGRVGVVSVYPMPVIEKVEAIYPRTWLVRLLGRVPARLLTFVWVGLRRRPHIVGGFHLLINGLVAALLGRLAGARSLYFCVGGPGEVLDGGMRSESRIFSRLLTPDPAIERRLLQAVGTFDLVITMGSDAARYFRQQSVATALRVVPGGLDGRKFRPADRPPTTDLIFVGRLAAIKRVDLFLRAVKLIQTILPNIRATVVGDGPLYGALKRLACELGIESNVTFAGYQNDVGDWLTRSKVFVLTSDSEGLSLSLMEAMWCGLPAVVPQVGELGELVDNGVNGYLIPVHTPEAFAARLLELLTDLDRLNRFSRAARQAAARYEMGAVSRVWEEILAAPEGWGHDAVGARLEKQKAVESGDHHRVERAEQS